MQRAITEQFVPLKIDATEANDESDRLTEKYGVPGLPTVLMFGCADKKSEPAKSEAPAPLPAATPAPAQTSCAAPEHGPGRLTGFEPPAKMLERMRRVQCTGDHC